MDAVRERTRRIQRGLGDLWSPIFGGFGRVTPIQAEAMPVLLDRRDAVLTSPTASGKSEAALAPAIRDLIDNGGEGAGLLWVIPTRALVADMDRRFRDLLGSLGVPAAFRTSDRAHLPAVPPRALFTTPESLDSLLCRRRDLFQNSVRTVVLDELHLLDGTPRGDQLRVLLRRLVGDHLKAPPHRVILSATVADPPALAARYIGDAVICTSGRARAIDFALAGDLDDAIKQCRAAKRHKVLVFCNSRRDCERLAREADEQRLWPRDRISVHHGSLAAALRREVEAGLREARVALCFATMTLEIGVDIGDLDAIILHEAPPTREAFYQRVGRGCRREDRIFSVGIAAGPTEAAVFEEYLAPEDAITITPTPPDLSVVVHQLLSMVFAAPRGRSVEDLHERVEPLCSPAQFSAITDHLVSQGLLRSAGRGRLAAGETVMDMGEKGTIHTNIDEPRTAQVVDQATGKPLGEVSWDPRRGGTVVLGGRSWAVSEGRRGQLVARAAGTDAGVAAFAPRRSRGRFARFLPPELLAPSSKPT